MGGKRGFALLTALLVVLLPFTTAESTAPGELCSPFNNQCPDGTYCSGQKNAFQMTRCCPDGSEYNFYLQMCYFQCVDSDGDGYGQYCSAGHDCDDTDPLVKNGTCRAKVPIEKAREAAPVQPRANACEPIESVYNYDREHFFTNYGQTKAQVDGQLIQREFYGHPVKIHEKIIPAYDCVLEDLATCDEMKTYEIKKASSYFWRCIGGHVDCADRQKRSMHSWAVAIDMNYDENPYRDTLVTDLPQCLIDSFKRYGFDWGGDWGGPYDAMHFEYHGEPFEIDAEPECVPGVCNDDGDNNCDGFADQACLTEDEVVLRENDICHVWEILENDQCVMECPECDLDEDGYQNKVEVRYYANPVIQNDTPGKRMWQQGCPDYYTPEFATRFRGENGDVSVAQFLWYIATPDENLPHSVGGGIGVPHGVFMGLYTDAIGLLQLATLPIRLHWKLVKDIFETRGNPIALVERYGYEAAQTKEALLETLTNLDRVYATEKNRWFDERSSFAAGIHDYESECSDVTLNKGYTVGYGEGFVASQVALLLVPVTKLSWLSKFKILLKFKSFGKLAGKGAKIFDKVGELKWLSTLPDDQARVLTEKVAQIAAREGKDVARGVAKTRALYEQGAGAERIVAELKKVPGVKQGDNFPNKPVQKIKIENFYGHSNDDVANTLMQASHQDIKDPILLVRIGDKYMINDGVGRTTRAIWKGETEINAKIIKNYDHLSDLKFQAGLSDEGRIHLRNWEKFSEKIDIDETKRLLE